MSLPGRTTAWAARRLAAHLAGRALVAEVYGDRETARQITAAVIEAGGKNAGLALTGVWCEAILAGVPRRTRRRARRGDSVLQPYVENQNGTASELTAEDVAVQWAGRLVGARACGDRVMFRELIDVVPGSEIEDHLAVLRAFAANAVTEREADRP